MGGVNISVTPRVVGVNFLREVGYVRWVSTATPYHHGNLREALVEAAVEAARERGPDGLVLRELARRVGVSHNAAYRHFAHRDELVSEVAGRGLEAMMAATTRRLAGVTATEPVLRARRSLAELGRGYVDFALSEPGLFRVVFAAYPSLAEPVAGDDWPDPLGQLGDALDTLVEVGFLAPEYRLGAEVSCWAGVHGFAMLHIDGPMRDEPESDRVRALDRMLATIDRSYAATTATTVRMDDLVNDR